MKSSTLSALAAAAGLACAHTAARDPESAVSPAPKGPSDPAVLDPAALDEGAPPEHVTYDEYQQNEEEMRESLDALAALEVVTFGELLVDAPQGSFNCYGPCESDPVAQNWMITHARQVDRLSALVDLAEEVAQSAPDAAWEEGMDALRALDTLQILDFESLYREADANCYVGLCPEDPHRAGVVVALVDRIAQLP